MEIKSENPSIAAVSLAHTNLIVERILGYLGNSDLMKCRQTCFFWKNIADEILKNRIFVITKDIPTEISKKALVQPNLLLPYLDFQHGENIQLISEFSQFNISDWLFSADQSDVTSAFDFPMMHFSTRMNECDCLSSEKEVGTRIAVFPKLPGVHLQRFSFCTDQIQPSFIYKMLTEIKKIPEEELKCLFWFTNDKCANCQLRFPDITVPSVLLSSLFDCSEKIDSIEYYGIAITGKSVNAVLFDVAEWDKLCTNFKVKLTKTMKELKDHNIEAYKCVAFMFTNCECSCPERNRILSLFKDSFPDVPVLYFFDKVVENLTELKIPEFPIRLPRNNFIRCAKRTVIVLIWIK